MKLAGLLQSLITLGWLMGALSSGALAQVTPNGTALTAAELGQDTTLKRAIRLDEAGISVAEWCQQFSTPETPLQAGPSCSDQKLQIHVQARSQLAVMLAIAELLPGGWTRLLTGHGYRLDMTQAAIKRRERWWDLFMDAREMALAAQRKLLLDSMRAAPISMTEYFSEPVSQADRARMIAQQRFWNSLPANLQEQIADQSIDWPFYSLDVRLPAGNPGGMVTVNWLDLSPEAQNAIASAQPNAQSCPILFQNFGGTVETTVQPPGKRMQMLPFSVSALPSAESLGLRLNQQSLPRAVKQYGGQVSEAIRLLAGYQSSTVWNNHVVQENRGEIPSRRVDQLDRLADTAHIEFVADYYSKRELPLNLGEKTQPLTRPLKEELDHLAKTNDVSWRQETDGLYLFRNNRWYRDDALEAPNRIVKPWLVKLASTTRNTKDTPYKSSTEATAAEEATRGRVQMNWAETFVTELTPWQVANGLVYLVDEHDRKHFDPNNPAYAWWPFGILAKFTELNLELVNFYAALDTDARDAIFEGTLRFDPLPLAQQRLARDLAPDLVMLLAPRLLNYPPVLLRLTSHGSGGWSLVMLPYEPHFRSPLRFTLDASYAPQ